MIDRYLLGDFLDDSVKALESHDTFQKHFANFLKMASLNPNKFDKSVDNVVSDFTIYHGQLQLIIECDSFTQTNSVYLNYVPFINLNISSAVLNIYRISCLETVELFNMLPGLKRTFKRKKIRFEHINLFDGNTDQHILKINLTDNEKIEFFYNIVRAIEVEINTFQNINKDDFS